MSTNNFIKSNASEYFVVLTTQYDEGGEAIENDEWQSDDLKSNLQSKFEQKFGSRFEDWRNKDLDLFNNSYGGAICGTITESKYYDKVGAVSVELIPVIQGAYYDGATLDWFIRFCVEGDNMGDSAEDVREHIAYIVEYYCDGNGEKLGKVRAKQAVQWLQRTSEKLIEKLEEIYKQCCEHRLTKIGGFSDGTAVYETVNTIRAVVNS